MRNYYLSFLILLFSTVVVKAQYPYQAFYGNLHSHTGNSDGANNPVYAYNYARDSASLDFLAVTDHLEQIDVLEWYYVKANADAVSSNGTYVGIAGWEWGSPLHGHVNVFNTTSIITDVTNLWYTTDLPAFYNWILTHAPALAQFNHPGEETYFTNWNDFEYIDTILDNAIPLLEVQNVQQATDYYEYALNKGWHLSPVWNQDNHSADWGTKNNGRAGIWANSLSRTDLFDAIKMGRTFATMDKNAFVWLDISGVPMGRTLQRYSQMPLHIKLNDAGNEAWQQIELVSNLGVVMSFSATGNLDTIVPITLMTDNYLFLRAVQADSDYIWSAPLYFNGVITGVAENNDTHPFIYPNPSKGMVHINPAGLYPYIVEVFDAQGRLLYQVQNKHSLNFENEENGLFFIRIIQDNKVTTLKLMVVK
ncbi:MAG: hypothetical protein BWY70_01148 [Bacteroidetes bacterium ADurb.Bin408]|nr:MAG: hypothetical protein BWY70_01148 [Bacteroidetes bacterium ADurb.Bin408]